MMKSKPGTRRVILCPRCDASFEISTKTQSTMCPGCNKIVRTEDEEVASYCARQELFTEADVTVTKKGHLIAEVRVRNLEVAGEVKGAVRARESVTIDKTGKVIGNVTTPTLVVKEGGSLVGYCMIGIPVEVPQETPAPKPVSQAS